jgi:uncharacterized protein
MAEKKVGRREFMKASATVLGVAAAPLWSPSFLSASDDKSHKLEFRKLGRTDLKVTSVSMGVMNCSDPSVVNRAVDYGINFFDTAHVYMGGRNEEMLGKALKGKRAKVFIQTKIKFKSTEKENRSALETSLKRLQTDYVDVLLAHSLQTADDVVNPATIDFLKQAQKEGKTRYIGFSSHTSMATLLNEASKHTDYDVALVSYNFTHGPELKKSIETAAGTGIGIIAMKTQAGGYNSDKMNGLNPHQAALKYVLQDQNISCAIPGVTTTEQMDQSAAVMAKLITAKDSAILEKYGEFLNNRICTMCGGCIGSCPSGVTHVDFLRILMYLDGYNSKSLAQEVAVNENLKDKMKICGDCASCAISCARGINIHAQIKAVGKFYC